MYTDIALLAGFIFGAGFRQTMGFADGLKVISENMAIADAKQIPPINYQNGITPPWLTNATIISIVGFIASVIVAFYFGGIWQCLLVVATFVAGMLISAGLSGILSVPKLQTYYRIALHNLANREADFRRDGDLARADVAAHHLWLMGLVIGDDLKT